MDQKNKELERKLKRTNRITMVCSAISCLLILCRLIAPMVLDVFPHEANKGLLLSSLVFVAIAFISHKIHINIMFDLLEENTNEEITN